MIYLKKIIPQDIERTPTFSVEAIREFFKIDLDNGQSILKSISLSQKNLTFNVRFQKRETRNEYRVFLNEIFTELNLDVDDILIFRKVNNNFICESIRKKELDYPFYDYFFEDNKNHQIIISESERETNNDSIIFKNFLNEFINWFISKDGGQHNYFSNSFSRDKNKLKEELLQYETIYKKTFDTELFKLNLDKLETEIKKIEDNLNKEYGEFYEYSKKKSTHMPRAILGNRNCLKFLKEKLEAKEFIRTENFLKLLLDSLNYSGLIYSPQLIHRFISSLLTKPFLILTGLSGSGKTKLAQAFVQWISEDETQYKIIPVGADWTNREPLLGYPNALQADEYILPENGALELMIEAAKDENQNKPYFLILDEMNLSHVERYFADFLSTMESKDSIPLHSSEGELKAANSSVLVPQKINLPTNLFIIGTVNIDETTHMFSPKVLDRANTIEFRISPDEMEKYFLNMKPLEMEKLIGEGSGMGTSFVQMAKENSFDLKDSETITDTLKDFFKELSKIGAEFGYRTASEILKLCGNLEKLNEGLEDSDRLDIDKMIDIAIMQKLLPKVHGSKRQLSKTLIKMAELCLKEKSTDLEKILLDEAYDYSAEKYQISLEKIARMYRAAINNGFASFAEA